MTAPRLLAAALAALLCTAAVPDARAHSELPTESWCAHGLEVEIASFDIPPPALAQMQQDDICPPPGSPIQKDCGQFDDDYGVAKSAAAAMCAAYQPHKPPATDIGSVIFLIETPQYVTPDHHAVYSVQHGLKGSCVRCVARPVKPVRPVPVPVPVGS